MYIAYSENLYLSQESPAHAHSKCALHNLKTYICLKNPLPMLRANAYCIICIKSPLHNLPSFLFHFFSLSLSLSSFPFTFVVDHLRVISNANHRILCVSPQHKHLIPMNRHIHNAPQPALTGNHLVHLRVQHKQRCCVVCDELLVSVDQQTPKLKLSLGVACASAGSQDRDFTHTSANTVFEDVGVANGAADVGEPDAAARPCSIQNSILHLAQCRNEASTKASLTAKTQTRLTPLSLKQWRW